MDHTDILCFFKQSNAIISPEELWFEVTAASLKRKRNVLLLEQNVTYIPVINLMQRWEVGDRSLWLAPRSLSVISAAYADSTINYQELKIFLTTFK
jgi:hypothetical protein